MSFPIQYTIYHTEYALFFTRAIYRIHLRKGQFCVFLVFIAVSKFTSWIKEGHGKSETPWGSCDVLAKPIAGTPETRWKAFADPNDYHFQSCILINHNASVYMIRSDILPMDKARLLCTSVTGISFPLSVTTLKRTKKNVRSTLLANSFSITKKE